MPWTSAEIMTVLYIVVAVMLIIVLYHVLFIAVDLRRTLKRVDRITESAESIAMKPLAVADQALDWVTEYFAQKTKHSKHVVHEAHAHHEGHKHEHKA
jgi:hypothetical protein